MKQLDEFRKKREADYSGITDAEKSNIDIKLSNDSLMLETTIPGDNKYFYKQILYINKDTKNPEKMEILNSEGKKSFVVNYKEFECRK